MNIKLDHNDVALTKATTSISKPILNNMCVRNGSLISADGFMLAMRKAVCDKQEKEVLLPAKIINSLKVNSKRHADINANSNTIEVNFIDKKGNNLPDEYPVTYTTHNIGSYPDIEALFGKTEKKAEIALNVGLLKRLLSCLPEKGILKLRISDTSNPVEYHCNADERPIYGLLMPMFVEWTNHKWHSDTIKNKTGDMATPSKE